MLSDKCLLIVFSDIILGSPNSFGRRSIFEILRGAHPEHYEVLCFDQDDRERRAQNDN